MTKQIETVEDQPYAAWKPLTWGQTWTEFKSDWPDAVASEISLAFGEYYSVKLNEYSYVTIFNFLGDCGALYFKGANSATTQDLKDIKKVASSGGFNKVFCTVVKQMDKKEKQDYLDRFNAIGFICINDSISNRNYSKTSLSFILPISDCTYKGY